MPVAVAGTQRGESLDKNNFSRDSMKMSAAEVEFLNVRKGYVKGSLSVELSVNKVGPADRIVLNRCDSEGKVSQVVSTWVDQPAGEPVAQRRHSVSFDPTKLIAVKASSPSLPLLFFFTYENVSDNVRVVGESKRFYLCEKEADLASLCPPQSRTGSQRSSFDVVSFPEGDCSGNWPSNPGDRLSPLSGWSDAEIMSYHRASQVNTDVLSGESFEEVHGGSLDVMEIGPDDIQRVAEAGKSDPIAGSVEPPTPDCDDEDDDVVPIFAEDEDTVVPMPTGAPASVAYEFVSLPREPDAAEAEQGLAEGGGTAAEKEETIALTPEVQSRASLKGSTERNRHRSSSADSPLRLSPHEKDVPVPPLERSLSDSYNLVSLSVLAAEGELRKDQEVMLLKRQLKEAHKQSGLLERKLEEETESKRQLEMKVSEIAEELVQATEASNSAAVELQSLQMECCALATERDCLLEAVAELSGKLAGANGRIKELEEEMRLKTNEKLQAYKEARLFAQELNQVKRVSPQEMPTSKERPQSAKPSKGSAGDTSGAEAEDVGVSLATASAYRRRKSTSSCGSCDKEQLIKSADRVRRITSHQSNSDGDLSELHEVSSFLEAQLFASDKPSGDVLIEGEEDISDEDLSKLAMSLQGLQSVCPYCKKFLRGFETELLRNLHYEDCSKYQKTVTVLEAGN